jgi:DNA-binding beta-propeller fold protein YncE
MSACIEAHKSSLVAACRAVLLAALLLAALLLAACAPRPERIPETSPFYWPAPPAQPRFVYETSLRSSRDVRADSDADRLRRLVTGEAERDIGFEKPYGVAAGQGMVYVTDTAEGVVKAFDVPRRRFFRFGFRREGVLKKPLGIAVDASLRVYVADAVARRVVVYDRFGLFLRTIGDQALLAKPTDVAVVASGERVYVVDTGGIDSDHHAVVAYDAEGQKRFEIGGRGSGPGQFNLPVAASVAADGTLYVLDAGNFRVQAFTPEGRLLRAWGGVGRSFGHFARPKGIAVDADGIVYVVDAAFGNVQAFTPDGRLLLPFGRLSREDAPGSFALPSDIAVDETGRVYVLDQMFRKIDVIRRLSDAEGLRLLEQASDE